MKIERFAPSPTGLLHLGHAYSALLAYSSAVQSGGKLLLRIEDIDQVRCREIYVDQILDDLKWLGIKYETPILKQSSRFPDYEKTLQSLWNDNYLFSSSCSILIVLQINYKVYFTLIWLHTIENLQCIISLNRFIPRVSFQWGILICGSE